MDFADAELTEDAGDVTAAAVARDLTRGAAISAGGEEEEEEEEEALMAPPAGCRDASRRAATASHPFSAPPPLVRWCLHSRLPLACLPSRLPLAPVVAPPPPCNFASTSSLPSGCRNLQGPTCRTAAASRPLAASASRCTTSASQRATASQLAVSLPLPMSRRRCHQSAGVFAVVAIVSVTLGDYCPHHSLSSLCCHCRSRSCRRHCRRRHSSPSSLSSYPVTPSPTLSTSLPVARRP